MFAPPWAPDVAGQQRGARPVPHRVGGVARPAPLPRERYAVICCVAPKSNVQFSSGSRVELGKREVQQRKVHYVYVEKYSEWCEKIGSLGREEANQPLALKCHT